jgi:hypothetical protein
LRPQYTVPLGSIEALIIDPAGIGDKPTLKSPPACWQAESIKAAIMKRLRIVNSFFDIKTSSSKG